MPMEHLFVGAEADYASVASVVGCRNWFSYGTVTARSRLTRRKTRAYDLSKERFPTIFGSAAATMGILDFNRAKFERRLGYGSYGSG